jgi:hypothetical protein
MVSASDLADIKDMSDGLAYIGEFLKQIMSDENAMLFLVLGIIALMLATLLRKLLGKIPLFEPQGDLPCNGQGTVIAWCMSLLSVLSIGWMAHTKGIGTAALVTAMVGPYSMYFIMLITILGTYWVFKGCENMPDKWRHFWTVAMFTFTLGTLIGIKTGTFTESPLIWLSMAIILGAGAGFIFKRRAGG